MKIKNYITAGLLFFVAGNACAMRPGVTINVDRYNARPTYYYQSPVVTTTYGYYPTYDYYTYWPTPTYGTYYDDVYWDYYYDTPASAFVKACAVTGILALALALIGAVMESH